MKKEEPEGTALEEEKSCVQVKVEKEVNVKKEQSCQHENNDSSIEDVSDEKKGTSPERMCDSPRKRKTKRASKKGKGSPSEKRTIKST